MTQTLIGNSVPLDLDAIRASYDRTDVLLDSLAQKLSWLRTTSPTETPPNVSPPAPPSPSSALDAGLRPAATTNLPTPSQPLAPASPVAVPVPRHWGALLLLVGVAFLAACGMVLSRMPASLHTSAPLARLDATTFTGTIKPASQITIAAPTGSTVRRVLVRVGETVSAGQPLIAIDDRAAREALEAAELEYHGAEQQVIQLERSIQLLDRSLASSSTDLAEAIGRVSVAQRNAEQVPMRQWRDSPERSQAAFDQAAAKLERVRRLRAAGIVSDEEVEDAEIAVRIAENDLENAHRWETAARQLQHAQEEQARLQLDRSRAEYRQQREDRVAQLGQARVRMDQVSQRLEAGQRLSADASVRATVAGVVVEVPVKVGDQVAGGSTLVRLATLDELLVEVPVAASLVNTLRVGQPVIVTLPTIPLQRVDGSIATINPIPTANMNHTVEVRFENRAGTILSGQPAEIMFKYAEPS